MLGRLIAVSGTGTEIGKTHLACGLLAAGGGTALGIKPIESGVEGDEGADQRLLREASPATFHVKHPPPYRLRAAVSPHLAARRDGILVDLPRIAGYVAEARAAAAVVLLELPGGLFSPLAEKATNADLLHLLKAERLLLVCPDRLGVLHDAGATLRAARASGLAVSAMAVVTPASPDASTGTNAAELRDLLEMPVFAVGRGTSRELGRDPIVRELYRFLAT